MLKWVFATVVALACLSNAAAAGWMVKNGRKLMSMQGDPTGLIAVLPAEKTPAHITAYLQVECFRHPELSGKVIGIVTSKPSAPGFIGWKYQFDNEKAVQRGPYSRMSLTVTSLGDTSSDEYKGIMLTKNLRLTLLPVNGPPWTFEFNLTGAATAINRIPCVEKRVR